MLCLVITEHKKCLELLAQKFDRFQACATTSNHMQQDVHEDATCNIRQCWELLANNVVSICMGLKADTDLIPKWINNGLKGVHLIR